MAHGLQLKRSNDRTKRWRPQCRCGWEGGWTNSQQKARDEYTAHRRTVVAARASVPTPQTG